MCARENTCVCIFVHCILLGRRNSNICCSHYIYKVQESHSVRHTRTNTVRQCSYIHMWHSHVDDRLTLAANLTRIIAAVGRTSLRHLHSSLHSNRRLLILYRTTINGISVFTAIIYSTWRVELVRPGSKVVYKLLRMRVAWWGRG